MIMKHNKNNDTKPKISIITVVYNGEETIKLTIESIISHKKSNNIEYIVIDGKSTDNTNKILKSYSEYIDKHIIERDAGIYDAMNKGLTLASGEFIWFLNSGDQISDDRIVMDLISKITHNTQFIYSGVQLINIEGKLIDTLDAPQKLSVRLLSEGMHISHQSFIVRKSLANQYDLNYKLIADQKWIMQCISKAKENGHFFDRPISRYLLGGISDQRQLECVTEKIKMIKKDYPELYKANIHKYFLEIIKIKIKNYLYILKKLNAKVNSQLRTKN
ncbi:MAG: glycosyl transferase [Sutterellaceae bacterium]|nr:glycosyl transferase [Sutterellaceae bacterium]MBT84239.1 glycosyl transferase [Sutterellaceae bacterium]|tara:strand:+ start:87489 stop:88313 length:825 start_codon:yes stop_codon:yes gene_type:complete